MVKNDTKNNVFLAINTNGGGAMWWLKLGFSFKIFIGLYFNFCNLVIYIVNETKIGAKNDELVKHFKVDEDLDIAWASCYLQY